MEGLSNQDAVGPNSIFAYTTLCLSPTLHMNTLLSLFSQHDDTSHTEHYFLTPMRRSQWPGTVLLVLSLAGINNGCRYICTPPHPEGTHRSCPSQPYNRGGVPYPASEKQSGTGPGRQRIASHCPGKLEICPWILLTLPSSTQPPKPRTR
ncbi:hypothetical protein F4803DRAFT_16735 [Xylaria telfairii]|nr:hypothetical protein F4803DRAFT_16735 [Xylaria telfairii]